MKQKIAAIAFMVFIISSCTAQKAAQKNDDGFRYEANWESIRSHYKVPDWFRDAKFGIFLHWGVYAVPAYMSEKYPPGIYNPKYNLGGYNAYKYHREKYGDPSVFGYKDFVPMFKAENFNAKEWLDLFADAGAKYIVPVAEHHDGFAMYDSKFTRWDVVEMGPKRDVMKELADATRKAGLKFGMSSHFALNWSYYLRTDPKWDTNDPKYFDLYGRPNNDPENPDDEFKKLWWNRTTDIIDNYKPDLIWFDFGLDKPAFKDLHPRILSYYYNKGLDWHKPVVFQDKNIRYKSYPEDIIVLDVERGRIDTTSKAPWQTDTSIGEISWGFMTLEKYKSPDRLTDEFIDIVSKNGCLLLNIGPKADGTIPEQAKDILLAMGKWLKVNGEAIYGSRPWKTYGEGPTKIVQGNMTEKSNTKSYTAEDIRFTAKEGNLYAIALGWPENKTFNIKSLRQGNTYEGRKIKDISFVSGKNKLTWNQDNENLSIKADGDKPGDFAYVFKITF